MLILGFFQDQPMRNQCVMITLYQDIAKTSQIFIWWWAICGIIVQVLDALDQDMLIPTFTIYMALVQEALSLLLFLYICVIGGLRLYTIRFSVLDPTTEKWGVSDNTAVLRIRSSLWIFVATLTIVLWSTSTRSIVYFQLVQPELELSNLPTSTLILFCFVAALIGVCIGLTSIRFALDEKFEFAIIAIIFAALFDWLDGRIARLIKGTSEVGKELDSLADVISFGVAPAFIMYFWKLNELGRFGWLLCLIYVS